MIFQILKQELFSSMLGKIYLTEVGVMHEAGNVNLVYPDNLIPLPILLSYICAFFIVWVVLKSIARGI